MNAAAAPAPEFGTGLRSRIERRQSLEHRVSSLSSRDLVTLCADEPAARPARRMLLGSRDLAVRGAWGAFAA